MIAMASSSDKETIGENENPIENVTASQIFDDFEKNEIAAQEKYGNKIISVRGIIASIESYGTGAIVLLNDGNPENIGVKCYFNKDQKERIAILSKGEPIKVIGFGSDNLVIDYKLENCRLGKLGDN